MKLALFTLALDYYISLLWPQVVYDSCLVFAEVESCVNSGALSLSTERSQAEDDSHPDPAHI